ncbi:hypothetical protein B5807_03197 [Epicoccum nigrum]|jgi:fucose permease|uniref:Major facilitator superfamily (MFS) profile domain-containing protein n=1 Tax=Epicoccum nigrum TaxID=105696 RepID=A0A1Y2M8G1_EPING|nr:hypothetical protein B5807_03197 [Epicoccum nigrum]
MTTATPALIDTEPAAQHIALQNIRFEDSPTRHDWTAETLPLDTPSSTPLVRSSAFKVVAASTGFFFAGNNDGSLGAYEVGTEYIALVYGATFLGWLFAAATNGYMAHYLGLGMILALGAGIQVAAHALRCWTPPFPLFIITSFLQAAGMAYNESHANTFVASLQKSHRPLGFIHAMYALGTLVSPFVAIDIE